MTQRFPSSIKDASPLGEPLHFVFSGRTAPNRFLKAAMTERMATWDPRDLSKRGCPTSELVNVYKRWGEGGMGHVITGNIMIDCVSLEAPGNMIITPDHPFEGERFEIFKELATQAKKDGSLITAQVNHPGRQVAAQMNPNPVSASDVHLELAVGGFSFAKPHAASQEEIDDIVHRFAYVAEYLYKAGFDGIELHAAHGYLLAQFLAKTTNKRTDKYGGSLENRARIILEITQAIRERVPTSTGFIVGIKLNSVEFQEGGFSPEEAKEVCKMLEGAHFDFVELSGGTYQSLGFSHRRESTRQRESFFLDFAEMITPALTKTKVYVTGGFRTVEGMVNALKSVDGVGLGRPASQEFRLGNDMLNGEISGVIDQKISQDDFRITTQVAGAQMKQVGRDEEPIDMGVEENVATFMERWDAFRRRLEAGDEKTYGYVDMEKTMRPYGKC
ncbi:hypothetical protein NW759_016529 [Fusarium solani]|nr:hypothetical protein NW759_016529 [Fusarium solani]